MRPRGLHITTGAVRAAAAAAAAAQPFGRGLAHQNAQVLCIQRAHAVAMASDVANLVEDVAELLNEGAHARRERDAAAVEGRDVCREAQRKARGKGDHDGRVVGHGEELLFALDGGAHNVERGGEAGGAEKVAHLERRGGCVDDG